MSDGVIVILGTLAIFAVIAVSVVALVYGRSFSMKATTKSVEVHSGDESLPSAEQTAIERGDRPKFPSDDAPETTRVKRIR